MLIVFLKSKPDDRDQQMPLPEKLRRILLLRVKEAKTDHDRERAKRDLAKFEAAPGEEGSASPPSDRQPIMAQ